MNQKNLQVMKLQLVRLEHDIAELFGYKSMIDKKLDVVLDRQQLMEEIIRAETEKTGEEWSVEEVE